MADTPTFDPTHPDVRVVDLTTAGPDGPGAVQLVLHTGWPLTMRVVRDGVTEWQRASGDLWAQLRIARREYFEPRCEQIGCNGARPDVTASRMLREGSGGMRAYVVRLGEHARTDELVDVFGPCDPTLTTTVDAQDEATRAWSRSLPPLASRDR